LLALATGAERRAELERTLRESVAKVIKLPAARIPLDRPLRNLGVDSVMSVELRNHLEKRFGTSLSATLIWNYPTIVDIASFLAAKVGIPLHDEDRPADDPARQAGVASPPSRPRVPDPPHEDVALEELLARELAEIDQKLEAL
jgi:phthiocerol/phenolphthiocerol synthesis type-I polyketide synthase A